jgi:hypothetical protein
MTKKLESGKSRLIKGSLLYAWEEMKTMNMTKFRALGRIFSGYVRMKFKDRKPVSDARNSDFSLNGR